MSATEQNAAASLTCSATSPHDGHDCVKGLDHTSDHVCACNVRWSRLDAPPSDVQNALGRKARDEAHTAYHSTESTRCLGLGASAIKPNICPFLAGWKAGMR